MNQINETHGSEDIIHGRDSRNASRNMNQFNPPRRGVFLGMNLEEEDLFLSFNRSIFARDNTFSNER